MSDLPLQRGEFASPSRKMARSSGLDSSHLAGLGGSKAACPPRVPCSGCGQGHDLGMKGRARLWMLRGKGAGGEGARSGGRVLRGSRRWGGCERCLTLTHSYSLLPTLTYSHSLSLTLTHGHSLTLTRTHSLTHSPMNERGGLLFRGWLRVIVGDSHSLPMDACGYCGPLSPRAHPM